MAIYCEHCGTQIKTGGKFCQACGSPVPQPAQAAAPPMPPPPSFQEQASPYWASSAPPPVSPPPRKSNALKVVLITLGVLFILVMVSLIVIGIFVRRALDNVSVKSGPNNQAEVAVNLPGGKLNISAKGEISEEKLGVPIYPNAKLAAGTGSVSVSGGDEKSSGSFSTATLTTTDSFDQVVDFYKDKLGGEAKVVETNEPGKRSAVVKVMAKNVWKAIVIEDDGSGATKIVITSAAGKTAK